MRYLELRLLPVLCFGSASGICLPVLDVIDAIYDTIAFFADDDVDHYVEHDIGEL